MTVMNPYAAPKAAVADETVALDADYVPGGQARPVGHGWAWIAEGWHLFRRQPGIWIGIALLLVAIMLVAALYRWWAVSRCHSSARSSPRAS